MALGADLPVACLPCFHLYLGSTTFLSSYTYIFSSSQAGEVACALQLTLLVIMATNDDVLIGFGPAANCTLDLCPLEWSVFRYLPSIPANTTFIAIFSLLLIAHLAQGIRYKSWVYMSCVVAGCGLELAGYAGRIMLHENPFDFNAFLINLGMYIRRSTIAMKKWTR
jgi:succinate dehydrogenase/fumarate reductase cytochrome b subunit